MRCLVVGAGAWGLPAATELATRGHAVTLLDRYGVGNLLSSSAGPTRLWRLTHPDAVRVRLARRSVEAWERLEARSGRAVHLRRGLLWRDDESLPGVVDALRSEGVEHTEVAAADVARFFPGLRPDGRDAVWQPSAGPLLAAESLRAHADLYADAGGTTVVGARRRRRRAPQRRAPCHLRRRQHVRRRRRGAGARPGRRAAAGRARGGPAAGPAPGAGRALRRPRRPGRRGRAALPVRRAARHRAGRVHDAHPRGRLQDRPGLPAARPAAR